MSTQPPVPDQKNLPPGVDITGLLRDGRHFAERHGDMVHIIDSITGNTLVVYASNLSSGVPGHLIEHVRADGTKVWIEKDSSPGLTGGTPVVPYSPHLISLMCQRIAEGAAVTKLCQQPGFPSYAQLRLWARVHPWIDEELDRARRDRAETMRDNALEEALKARDKNDAPAQALKTETYKWAAGTDHEKYNPKTKVEATLNTPTQIIVHTGIQRDVTPTPGLIPQELQQYDKGS